MRTGFEVILSSSGEVIFNILDPKQSLITFAQDKITGIAVILIGKLYYKNDLKTDYPQLFQTDIVSDVDLILAIVRDNNCEGLEKLEGDFAFVFYHPDSNSLIVRRDPLGAYPLYWTNCDRTLRVSTNLRLLAQRSSQNKIDLDYLGSFLMFPYAFVELATTQTVFKKIHRVFPGHLFQLTAFGEGKILCSWDWKEQERAIGNLTLETAGLEFRNLFSQAIQERVQTGKVASHLSGGMDSSSIVCLAREMIQGGNLITLSLVYQMRSLVKETDYIQMILDRDPPVESHFVNGDEATDFQWFLEELPEHDEPYPALFHLGMEKVLIDVAAKFGVTTILSGGGAELITQGNHLYLADLIEQGQVKQALSEARKWAEARNASLWSILAEWALKPLIPAQLGGSLYSLLHEGYSRWPDLKAFTIAPWIRSDFAKTYHLRDQSLSLVQQISQYPREETFNRFTLQTAVGNWTAWSLANPEGIHISYPFLDPRLISYSLGLPRSLREVPGVTKPILKAAMKDILPEPIRTRKYKGNFNQVYWQGLSQNLANLENMVAQSKIDDLGVFDTVSLITALQQHTLGIGSVPSGSRISLALAVIAWFDRIQKAITEQPEIPTFSQKITSHSKT
jgi:asparagine synthase (glutamine-hydrolysing)